MNALKNALVVPTIREANIKEFLREWSAHDFDTIVVEDNPQKSFNLNSDIEHFSWKEIDEELGNKSWIISRRDSAIRSFGFYYAYKMGYENIFTLDDDCLPINISFIEDHLKNLNNFSQWTHSVPGQRTRGFPYGDVGKNTNVKVSMGLWENVPDYDAIQELSGNNPKLVLPTEVRLMPANQYFPLCGMNMCFKREIAPLMYFPLQGKGWPYGRFDDIWCGVIMKKVCDWLRFQIAVGPPNVNHTRASNVFKNIIKEAPGIGFHDTFWKSIDEVDLTNDNPIGCMVEISEKLSNSNDEYLRKVGYAIKDWADIFLNVTL